jgi:N-acetylglucosamine-6-phosphate deacetylase
LDYHLRIPLTVTVAPELLGTEPLLRRYAANGVRFNVGHSHATFSQVAAAIDWGVRHVDHLFCAMSDRARLRQTQPYPMRGGVLEAALYFDQLTTEVIADGKHLAPELLQLAYKIKGPQRLAVVTDAMRAVDQPDGHYMFGPQEAGVPVRKADGVGLTADGIALASGVMGLDHAIQTLHFVAHIPLHHAIEMASLTPARILGLDHLYGSLQPGKVADIVVWNQQLQVQQVYIDGQRVW